MNGYFRIMIMCGILAMFLSACGSVEEPSESVSATQSPTLVSVVQTTPAPTPKPTLVPTPQPTGIPTPTPLPEINHVMVGDMLMHERVVESGLQEDGSYNFDHLFVHVQEKIEAADLALVNQETILGVRN